MIAFQKPGRHVDKVFIHCSASDYPAHDNIEVIRRWHIIDNDWSDVGYHYFIQSDGAIQGGRSVESPPASQRGYNTDSLSICLHGLNQFKSAQMRSLWFLCSEIAEAYGGDITFHGHCEVSPKLCPNFDYKSVLSLDSDGYMPLPWGNDYEVNTTGI